MSSSLLFAFFLLVFTPESGYQSFNGLNDVNYLFPYPADWTLDCATQDCQCYVFPYIPQPYPLNSTGMRQRQLALTGTTNVLRANGVRLINDCQYLDIENEPELYCKILKNNLAELTSYSSFNQVCCKDMHFKLDEKLGNIMRNGVNTLVFFHPSTHLEEVSSPARIGMMRNKQGKLKKLVAKYPPVGQIEVLLALCLANKVFRLNVVSDSKTGDTWAGLRYQAEWANIQRRGEAQIFSEYNPVTLARLNVTGNFFNIRNISLFNFGIPVLTNSSFVHEDNTPVNWRDGQSLLDALVQSKWPKPSLQDNTKYPGAWVMLYPWWDKTGGVSLYDDFIRPTAMKGSNGSSGTRSAPIGFQTIEQYSYTLDNSSTVVTTNSLMSLIPFFREEADLAFRDDIYNLLEEKHFMYDVTMSDFKVTENVSHLFRTLPEDQILARLVNPMLFPLLRTQVRTTKSGPPRDNQYFPVEGISAVITGCDIASFSCHSEVFPLNADDFTKDSKIVYRISNHSAFKKIADFLNRSRDDAAIVKCKDWCNLTTHIPVNSIVFAMDGNCENCLPCPMTYKKNQFRNGICTPCPFGNLRTLELNIDWGHCHKMKIIPYNKGGEFFIPGFSLEWVSAFGVSLFIIATFTMAGLGALKWFDKYEPVMDVFWDIYVWCWVGVLLGCSSTLLAQLPVNSFTCPFNFVFNTTANTFLQIVHFTRCVQSWIHIRRQASIRKADVVAEAKKTVTLTPKEASKLKTCRISSLFDSPGFRAIFILLLTIGVILYAFVLANFFVFPYIAHAGCKRLDAWNENPILMCYDAEKTGVILMSYIPTIILMLLCVILWRKTATVNVIPLQPCLIGIAALKELTLLLPVLTMMMLVDLNLQTVPILSNLLTLMCITTSGLIDIIWKIIFCNPAVAAKYPTTAYIYSNPPDDVDRIYYSSYPDDTLKRSLTTVLWETFGKDIESSKSNKELEKVDETVNSQRTSLFGFNSVGQTGSLVHHTSGQEQSLPNY